MGIQQQTPYYESGILIGALAIPALPGMRLRAPKNWKVPPIIGNKFQVNRSKGARTASVDVNLVVRDKANEALGSTLLNYFFTRGALPGDNTSVIPGGVQFWNGVSGFTMFGAKADSFTLSAEYGSDINFSCRFVGSCDGGHTDASCLQPLASAPAISAWDTSQILAWDVLNFGSPLTDDVWRFGLSYSNNHRPDRSMQGTTFPKAMNAGMPTAGFNTMIQAIAATVADDSSLSISLTGNILSRTFTLTRIVDNTPDDITVEVPENMRYHDYQMFSNAGDATGSLISYS